MIKIMLADDHTLIRKGIKSLLEFDENIKVVAEAKDGEECIEKLKNFSPDILLLDISMPKMNGIEVLEELKKEENPVKIILLTVHSEIEYLTKALDSGIDGYIVKDAELEELKYAINYILSGNTYIQPNLLYLLETKKNSKDIDKEKLESLTKRELEILSQVARGMFNKEIAINLNISERTVKNHISNIFKKIDVSDRTQAAVFAIRNKVIEI